MQYAFKLLRTIATASFIGALSCHGVKAADLKPESDTLAAKNPREILADWGIQFNATYIAEVFGNASGGTYIFMAFAEHPFGGDGVAPVPAR